MQEPRLTDGRLKIRHLALADALSTEGSLVAAAAQLRVSQPALTRTLRELELIMGVELFERRARGVEPTIYGSAFTEYARRILGSLNQASRHIVELADARAGTVTIGLESFGGHAIVAAATARMKAEHPNVTIVALEGSADRLLDGVETGQLDCAVGCFADVRQRAELKLRRYYSEPIALVARRGHPLLRRPNIGLSELADGAWVLPTLPTPMRSEFDLVLDEAGLLTPLNRVETDSPGALIALVAACDAIGVLPRSTAEQDSRVRILAPDMDIASLSIGVVTPTERPAGPASRALLRALLEVAPTVRAALTHG